ncbi:MAG: queuosine precursor transporter [Chlamydiales bacterium]|nr:queuosine precursor transporter [Chlamydiales bacterium]
MLNELLFIFHALLTITFILGALRVSKEFLLATTVVSWIFANLFVLKQIELFGLSVTASDAFSVGGSIGIALLNEFYGKKFAKRAVFLGFYLLVIFAIMSWIQLAYQPSSSDTMHVHYANILGTMPRLVLASLVAYLVSSLMNVAFSAFLQKIANGRYVLIRTVLVVGVVQLLDTLLFTYLGLYGILLSLSSIVLFSFIIKCFSLIISAPLVGYFLLKKKKREEKLHEHISF